MVNYFYKRSIVNIQEMAFGTYSDIPCKGADVVYMHSNDEENKCSNLNSCFCEYQCTLETDLKKTEDEILVNVSKNCRYEIRRATRENAQVEIFKENIPTEVIDDFENTYNQMFAVKGLANKFNRNLVMKAIEAQQLVITRAFYDDKNEAVYHAYLCDGVRTVLMYSASPLWQENDKEKANAIGRLNKYLHWEDIKYFKNENYEVYEWGGLKSFDNPNGIDKFKMEFGGQQKKYYNYTKGNTVVGKLYVFLVKKRSESHE